MIQRVLEPEIMDSPDDAVDYDTMDHDQINHLFVDDLQKLAGPLLKGPVLDVGTGTVRIPIEICRRDSNVSVVAIDFARSMLDLGQKNVDQAGLTERVELRVVDAKNMPFGDRSFPCVISNSIVHHIPEPRRVFDEMLRVLQVGGLLLVRDLLRPANEAELEQLVSVYTGDGNAHQRQLFADSLRAALTLDEVRDLVQQVGGDATLVTQTSDRHWTWAIESHTV